jgi:hypothetical protein
LDFRKLKGITMSDNNTIIFGSYIATGIRKYLVDSGHKNMLVSYWGGSDDGWIEKIEIDGKKLEKSKTKTPKKKYISPSQPPSDPKETIYSDIETLFYSILDKHRGGFEINEGGSGTFEWNLVTGLCVNDHEYTPMELDPSFVIYPYDIIDIKHEFKQPDELRKSKIKFKSIDEDLYFALPQYKFPKKLEVQDIFFVHQWETLTIM